MIAPITTTAENIPEMTSTRIARMCSRSTGSPGCSRFSSTSSPACQKNQVGRDGRPEDCDKRRHRGAAEMESWHRQCREDIEPVDVDGDYDGDVRYQRKAEPPKYSRVAMITDEYLDKQQHKGDDDSQGDQRQRRDQTYRSCHGTEVGRNVERVGEGDQCDRAIEDERGKRWGMRVARPFPLTSPSRPASSCTAAASGSENSAVHRSPNLN